MNSPEQRAELAWQMFVMACGVQLQGDTARRAMQKLVRAYGDARYEAGRARESHIHQQDEMNADVARLAREFARRKHEVDA